MKLFKNLVDHSILRPTIKSDVYWCQLPYSFGSVPVDLVYAPDENYRHAPVERIESRHGLRQLTYMKELSTGKDKYRLIDLDNDERTITAAKAIRGIAPFKPE